MKVAAAAWLSAETALANHNDNSVQYDTGPHASSFDAVEETGPIVEPIKVILETGPTVEPAEDALQIILESGSETSAPVKTAPRHRRFSTLKALLSVLRIRGQRHTDHLLRLQYKNAFDASECSNSENTDVLAARQREAELERIERLKTSGM